MISLIKKGHRRRHGHIRVEAAALRGCLLHALLRLLLLMTAHSLIIWFFEGLQFGDAVWLTLSTITTVGYGDFSASTFIGRAATVIFLYIGGIFLLAKTAGDYFDYRRELQLAKQKGLWRWNMSGHILILNTPLKNGTLYFERLIGQIRDSECFKHHVIQILTRSFPEGLPHALCRGGVIHYHGQPDNPEDLEASNAHKAEYIIILAKDEHNPDSDGRTFDILHRIRDMGTKAIKLAECVDDKNQTRLKNAGADIVLRPMRSYPEMMVRAIIAPGSEQIIENMFTNKGDEYRRFEIVLHDRTWKDVVSALIEADYGLAVAYMDLESGELRCNPPARTCIQASALILMVREENHTTDHQIKQLLNGH